MRLSRWVPSMACLSLAGLAGCAAPADRASHVREPGAITLSTDHADLAAGFRWAREISLGYVRTQDPVGLWYEAALPGRDAFCMRDVSHQVEGSLALGLYEHTFNMMRKFAGSIAESRDWCGFWEIDRLDRPAPVDYRSDEDFWYNLPANFDVVQAALRAWEWTGHEAWLEDPLLDEFYRRSMTDYIARWDSDGDGIVDSPESAGIRGIPTYWEGDGPRAATGGDLVAAQYAAWRAHAALLRARGRSGDPERAREASAEAERIRRLYNDHWWSDSLGRFHAAALPDGSFDLSNIPAMQIFPLHFGIVEPERAETLLETLVPGVNVEENSYLAEAHYRYGRDAEAFRFLLAQMDPALERRAYPENPFTAVGGVVRWLAGVRPLASEGLVETRPRLPAEVGWIELDRVPALDGSLRLRHDGNASTRLTRIDGTWTRWRAVLPGSHAELLVDGEAVPARRRRTRVGSFESFVVVDMERGQTRTVEVAG
jgi:hypothetical protein